jgi:hypothetical protein
VTLNDPRATRNAAVLFACLVLAAGGAACSNSVFDKCINVCQHVFYDCSGVIKIGNEIFTASNYSDCETRCQVAADGGGNCQDPGAAFDCLNDIPCEVFQPSSNLDAGVLLTACATRGKCGL